MREGRADTQPQGKEVQDVVKGKLIEQLGQTIRFTRSLSVHECVVQAVNQVTFSYRTSTEAAAVLLPQK